MPRWEGKESTRRSVENDAPTEWVGWKRILKLYEKALHLDEEKDTNQHALYFSTLFTTGSRVGECILLQPKQITWDDSSIRIDHMPVLKYRKRHSRTVNIRLDDVDPLAHAFIDFVEKCDTKYLLPGRVPFVGSVDPERHVCASTVYKKICEIDEDIWPHWLRDQRSWALSSPVEKGGRDFDPYLLREWFDWSSVDMTAKYAGRRSEKDIMRALGIVKLPTRRDTSLNIY